MERLIYILSIVFELGIIPVAVLIYKKKINFITGLFTGTFLFLLSFLMMVYSANTMYGYSMIDSAINEVFAEMEALYSSVYAGEQLAVISQLMSQMKNLYIAVFPAISVCANLVWAYILLMVSKGILAVFKRDVSGFNKFCDFKMSKTAVIVGMISVVMTNILGASHFGYAFLNITVIMFFAAMICGLSYVDFKFRNTIKFSVVRLIIYVAGFFALSLTMGLGFGILLFIGMMDAFFDFRTPKIKNDKES